jgi:hypothetical protein
MLLIESLFLISAFIFKKLFLQSVQDVENIADVFWIVLPIKTFNYFEQPPIPRRRLKTSSF